jgi:hypothetical protein
VSPCLPAPAGEIIRGHDTLWDDLLGTRTGNGQWQRHRSNASRRKFVIVFFPWSTCLSCLLGFRDNQPPMKGPSKVWPPAREDAWASLHHYLAVSGKIHDSSLLLEPTSSIQAKRREKRYGASATWKLEVISYAWLKKNQSLAGDNAQRGPLSRCRHCTSARDGLPRCPALSLTRPFLIILGFLARHAMDQEEESHYSQWIRRKTSWMPA